MNEQNNTKRNIFIRDVYANRYNVFKSSLMHDNCFEVCKGLGEFIKTEVVFEVSTEMPELKKGDRFYFVDKNMIVYIKDVMNNSNDTITYRISDNYIDDNYTIQQKSEQENILKNLIREREEKLLSDKKEDIFCRIKESGRYKRFFKLFDKMLKEEN